MATDEKKTENTRLNGRDQHPSYGLLQISRCTSSKPVHIFGSSIKHTNTIRMQLSKAYVNRDLSNDFYMTDDHIVEIEMSESQFAEMICSMNMGSGTPVTIKWLRGEGMIPECPYSDKRELFENEFKESIKKQNELTNQLMQQIESILDKPKVGKNDLKEALSLLHRLYSCMNDGKDFIYRQFNEQMDKTVLEAKGEVEAFVQNKMNRIAALAMQNSTETDDDIPIIELPNVSEKEYGLEDENIDDPFDYDLSDLDKDDDDE